MRASKHHNGFNTDDVGGGFRKSEPASGAEPATSSTLEDDDAGIYLDPVPAIATKSRRNLRNKLKAKEIAEARLNQISEELLNLADEIRYLNPLMAEALDTAWESADTALEILLDNKAW